VDVDAEDFVPAKDFSAFFIKKDIRVAVSSRCSALRMDGSKSNRFTESSAWTKSWRCGEADVQAEGNFFLFPCFFLLLQLCSKSAIQFFVCNLFFFVYSLF
jgi:hypothetical protein